MVPQCSIILFSLGPFIGLMLIWNYQAFMVRYWCFLYQYQMSKNLTETFQAFCWAKQQICIVFRILTCDSTLTSISLCMDASQRLAALRTKTEGLLLDGEDLIHLETDTQKSLRKIVSGSHSRILDRFHGAIQTLSVAFQPKARICYDVAFPKSNLFLPMGSIRKIGESPQVNVFRSIRKC